MSSDSVKTVRDFVTLVRGTTYKGDLVGRPGPALLGLGSIHPGGGFREADFKTYGGECPDKLMLTPGDLFASLKGATKDGKMIGSVARVPSSVKSGRLTQDTVKLEFIQPNKETENYLYWLLRTPQYREYCAGRAMGSAVVAMSREDFLSYEVPPLNSFRSRTVELLEEIEKRERLLRETNATLEAIAQALFKPWFVDFDPVHAKAAARSPLPAGEGLGVRETSNTYNVIRRLSEQGSPHPDPLPEGEGANLPEPLAALFPDSFEESPLGLVPMGWRVEPLDEIADFLNGLALQKFPPDGDDDLPVIKIAQLRKGDTVGADRASRKIKSEYIIQNGDVLFSWSGSLEVEVWCGGEGALNQHLFKVTSQRFAKWFFLRWTKHHLAN